MALFPLVKSRIDARFRHNFNKIMAFCRDHVFIEIGFVFIILPNFDLMLSFVRIRGAVACGRLR
jgi:hypothetical protein